MRYIILTTALLWAFVNMGHADDVIHEEDITPRIDVVFVLDTTGSMGGLIDGAKQRIWSIAQTMAKAQPTPDIRIGLVAYRDRGDQYITRRFDLSHDLDAVYAELMGYTASGGGDAPESVNQALHEAVTLLSWDEAPRSYRAIFLVGDAPPHMNYEDDVPYMVSCDAAVEMGIIINTIQCGNMAVTTPFWTDIAQRGQGVFTQVQQDGGAQAIATPQDAELVRLNQELEATRRWYGQAEIRDRGEARQTVAAELAAAAPAAALADRAIYNSTAAGRRNLYGANELLNDLAEGRVHLDDIDEEHLPADLQTLDPEARIAHIAELTATRERLNKELAEVQAQRLAFVATQSPASGDGFDAQMQEAITVQAAATADLHFEETLQTGP